MSVHSRIELVLSYGNIDITENDMDCLKPSTFINDNIINFYLKYMYRCMLNENQQQKVHIFDSFFCEALDQMDDARVIRWLRRVNIFEKDYLVIPAMIDQHWFLIIIRRPGNILHSITATEFNNANSYITHGRRPAILIMDSAPDHVKDKKPQMINYLYNFIRIACSVNGKYISVKHLRSHVPVREIDAKVQVNTSGRHYPKFYERIKKSCMYIF